MCLFTWNFPSGNYIGLFILLKVHMLINTYKDPLWLARHNVMIVWKIKCHHTLGQWHFHTNSVSFIITQVEINKFLLQKWHCLTQNVWRNQAPKHCPQCQCSNTHLHNLVWCHNMIMTLGCDGVMSQLRGGMSDDVFVMTQRTKREPRSTPCYRSTTSLVHLQKRCSV